MFTFLRVPSLISRVTVHDNVSDLNALTTTTRNRVSWATTWEKSAWTSLVAWLAAGLLLTAQPGWLTFFLTKPMDIPLDSSAKE